MDSDRSKLESGMTNMSHTVPMVDTSVKIRRLVYKMSSEDVLDEASCKHTTIPRIIIKMSSEQEHAETSCKHNTTIPRLIIFLNVVISPIIGILMAIRGNYDGKLSVAGIVLRIIYFVLFLIAIYFDHRFERIERWARILPKLFGVFLLGFQLVGVIPRYDCKQDSWRTCI